MKFAFFKGCKIPYYLEQYDTSTRAVLKTFGVRLVELNFNCCGYPNRDLNFESFVLSAARNMALAEKRRLEILTPCQCCYGTLKHAEHFLHENKILRRDMNNELAKEGLSYEGKTKVKHLLTVLCDDIGLPAIYASIVKPLTGLKVAPHYGCHALRPSAVVHFDDPLAPSIFEDLIAATGAKPVDWPRRLDCCGNPLLGKNDVISLAMMRTKIADAAESEADCICTACTYCQMQFDAVQGSVTPDDVSSKRVPSLLYTQLLGLSMGLSERMLGIKRNALQVEKLKSL
ncbi:MAG: disulfide reductase [Spirochaetes bacterium RBG_13_51_14]|nr:MAG: disulfide reductase [Spirochaetes bacterium RBG_13_51_14]